MRRGSYATLKAAMSGDTGTAPTDHTDRAETTTRVPQGETTKTETAENTGTDGEKTTERAGEKEVTKTGNETATLTGGAMTMKAAIAVTGDENGTGTVIGTAHETTTRSLHIGDETGIGKTTVTTGIGSGDTEICVANSSFVYIPAYFQAVLMTFVTYVSKNSFHMRRSKPQTRLLYICDSNPSNAVAV